MVGLAAIVAIAAAYLGNCMPGMGSGGSEGSATEESTKPAEPKAAAEADKSAAAGTTAVTVVGERCSVGDQDPAGCAAVCEKLGKAPDKGTVEIDAAKGTHGAVESLRTCLTQAGFSNVVVRSQ